MKILYYFMQYETPMYLWQNYHIVDELKHHDVEIEIFNPLLYSSMDEANAIAIDYVKKHHFDLFMTCNNETICYIATILEMKKLGIPTLLICFDNQVAPFLHKNNCSYFDCVWLTSPENENMYHRWKARTILLPYAANPYYFRYNIKQEKNRIAFVGTPYGSRKNMINSLVKNNIAVELYGKSEEIKNTVEGKRSKSRTIEKAKTTIAYLQYSAGRKLIYAAIKQKINHSSILDTNNSFLSINPPINLEAMSVIYAQFALSLSSTSARNTGILNHPVEIVNLRSFEIPMCGGIQFCRYISELSEYFEDGKEIIFYRNDEEMVEKAKFWLKPENERLRMSIRTNARKRAETEHTWFRRFKKVFDLLELK